MTWRKKILKPLHPILKRLAEFYLSRPRFFKYKSLKVIVYPGVFHPGFFFSTKVFLEFLNSIDLRSKKVLELGAGSGLISIYCAKQGAFVTASDINPSALKGLKENASLNTVEIDVKESDLFSDISPTEFDIILVNPPYYPKSYKSVDEQAWFCGENFEYFENLFSQLEARSDTLLFMILSEDCDLQRIQSIGSKRNYLFEVVHTRKMLGELNLIYKIRKA